MFERLKRRSLQKQTEKSLKNRDMTHVNDPLRRLGIIVDEHHFQDFEALYDFSDTLGILRKDVKVFSFLEVRKKTPSLRQNQINNSHFSWKGDIQNQNAKEFLDIPFDVLVCFNSEKNEFLDLMAARSKAKFKVSSVGADTRLFDLLIDIDPKRTEDFKNELKKYLEILKKI